MINKNMINNKAINNKTNVPHIVKRKIKVIYINARYNLHANREWI